MRQMLLRWAWRLMARRPPDFCIGGRDHPQVERWWVITRNPIFNVYLHRFRRDDDDRALHDHPWHSLSIVLQGGYWEELAGSARLWRKPGSLIFRRPRLAHRIVLSRQRAHEVPAVTLFITGPRLRTWGFHCPKGWVPWHQFVDVTETGNVGRGCGEHA